MGDVLWVALGLDGEWVGGAAGPGRVGANVRLRSLQRAEWQLLAHSHGATRVVASGRWLVSPSASPLDVVRDGAERALAAAWRRGLS